jgi:putative nucleotidyltransferase with HDIG domain
MHDRTSKSYFSLEQSASKAELRLLILEMIELQMLPTPMNRILSIPAQGYVRQVEIEEIVSADEALTGKILRVANSACFAPRRRVRAMSRAIKLLGCDTVKGLALSDHIVESAAATAPGLFDPSRYWAHALSCAYVSGEIAGIIQSENLLEPFLCGLLHDVGKAFLAKSLPDSYGGVLARLEGRGNSSWIESENQALGFTHAEVGAWLAQRWRFPKPIILAIANHHAIPETRDDSDGLSSLLRLADHLCHQELITLERKPSAKPLHNDAVEMEILRLAEADLLGLRRALAREKGRLRSTL